MIKMDDLYALTTSTVKVKDKKLVTFVLDPHESAEGAVGHLQDYFSLREKQQAIRLMQGGEERGYLLRTDLYKLMSFGTRGIGDGDGASLIGDPSSVTLTELCCPTAGCPQVLVVTRYDKNDPPTCDDHGTAMELCK